MLALSIPRGKSRPFSLKTLNIKGQLAANLFVKLSLLRFEQSPHYFLVNMLVVYKATERDTENNKLSMKKYRKWVLGI